MNADGKGGAGAGGGSQGGAAAPPPAGAPPNVLVYGATGYSGELITRFGTRAGFRIKVAGRSAEKVRAVAAANGGLEWAAFSLEDAEALDRHVGDPHVRLVVHAAGPFIKTFRPMVEACIKHGKHYCDIDGEIAVIEGIAEYDAQARAAGVMLLPAAGFDVVPSDVLVHYLRGKLPADAPLTKLHLFFAYNEVGSLVSRGTANVMKNSMMSGKGISWRTSHRITPVNTAAVDMLWRPHSDFGGTFDEPVHVGPAAMADVATAYHSIKVPSIETYVSTKTKAVVSRCLVSKYTEGVTDRLVDPKLQPLGPTDEENELGAAYIEGALFTSDLRRHRALLTGPAPYKTTYEAVLAVVGFVLSGDAPPGFRTPSSAYGQRFVEPCRFVIRDL